MAGTRLFVHTSFVIELCLLIVVSYYYASTEKFGAFNSVEPFVIDRSGWSIIEEGVSPVGFSEFARIITKIERLFGGEIQLSESPERNAFVEEMRQKISQLPLASASEGGIKYPSLNVQILVPQISDNSRTNAVKRALERGISKRTSLLVSTSYVNSSASITSCDDYVPENFHPHQQPLKPQIVILTGCTSIPENNEAMVEISRGDPNIVVRLKQKPMEDVDWNEVEQLLEGDVSSIISEEFRDITEKGEAHFNKLSGVSVELVDENPKSRLGVNSSTQTKLTFEALGQAFATSVSSSIQPLLRDLSHVYGDHAHVKVNSEHSTDVLTTKASFSIKLSTHLSAYLPLPDEVIEIDEEEAEDTSSTKFKYISTQNIANWADTGLNSHHITNRAQSINWVLFVPSQNHSPLFFHDESPDRDGTSVTFAMSALDDAEDGKGALSGLSLVNLDPSTYLGNDDEIYMDNMQQTFQNLTSSALLYLVGYIRSLHGLPPMPSYSDRSTQDVAFTYLSPPDVHCLTFWESEFIARNQWHTMLEKVLKETNSLMALLHMHRGLAFPEALAHKLNNATHLIRHSITLVEQGYPTQYSTSALHGSLHHIESLLSDPEFMELPHFAFDHYLAVFSPLILPLLMPLIAGLVREIKRYQKLRNKRLEEETESFTKE